jgi:hypothetical protein
VRYNKELCCLSKEAKIRFIIKTARHRWVGHVILMEDSEITKRKMLHKPEGNGGWVEPKARWIDGVSNDVK